MKLNFVYKPKLWTTFLYLFPVLLVLLLHIYKSSLIVQNSLLVKFIPDLALHISNFSISYIILMVVGYIWLLMDTKLNYILFLVGFVIALNFIFELFLPILNTLDIVDAYYGLVGSILSFLVLLIIKNYGLVLIDEND